LNIDGVYCLQDGKSYLTLYNVEYIRKPSLHVKIFRMRDQKERKKMKESSMKKNNYDDQKKEQN
jgi:hypothetical protein